MGFRTNKLGFENSGREFNVLSYMSSGARGYRPLLNLRGLTPRWFLMFAALLLMGCLTMTEAQTYANLDWDDLATGQVEAGLVTVRGRYLPHANFTALIRGVVSDTSHSLRVEGEVFDWQPQAGDFVAFWGRLEKDSEGYILHFHNGRELLDNTRQPRPMREPQTGQRIQVFLNVETLGTARNLKIVGKREDGVLFELPQDYAGEYGFVCLEATVTEKISQMFGLKDVVLTDCESL